MGQVKVEFFDTTLRDGAQSLPSEKQFPNGSKPDVARRIACLGVSTIEAGFPATPADRNQVEDVARTVGRQSFRVANWIDGAPSNSERPVGIAGLSRAIRSDIDATWQAIGSALFPTIHTFISTDSEHMAAKFPGMSPDEVLMQGVEAVRYAKSLFSSKQSARVEFSAEAASTTDLSFLERVVKGAVQAGADVINLPDTVGQRDPFFMLDFYSKAIKWIMAENPDVIISAHNHNDLGNAVPNSMALIMAALSYANKNNSRVKTQIESTVCGLGERAGNADIFPVVAGLFRSSRESGDSLLSFEFNPKRSVHTANYVLNVAGLVVNRQNPIVGSDIATHRSGIHSDGVLKGGYTIYTPFDPVFWGHRESAKHEDGLYQGSSGRMASGH